MSEERSPGFLHRWSRRKIDARQDGLHEQAPAPTAAPEDAPAADAFPVAPPAQADGQPAESPLPTLDDVRGLSPESDFSRFVVSGVAPDVKNAALKKLFSDPHYNVMDGLDTYIDDYTQLAPLPESELRKMAISKVFGFFEEEARCSAAALTEGVQAHPAPASEPAGDNAAMPDAADAGVAALPAPADSPAGLPSIDVPEPAAGSKP